MDGQLSRISGVMRLEKDDRTSALSPQVDEYKKLFDESSAEKRKENYTTVVNHYYDIATDFYEVGWGQSFHFASRHKNESHETSLVRHELWLAHQMGIREGQKVLDVGCGVAGPARNIARFTGAHIVGVNNNSYQIGRARTLNQQEGLQNLISFIKCDFMHIPEPDNSYDAVYHIEAACHAPDRAALYTELFRVLKPGGVLGAYEWVLTENHDPNDPMHVQIKKAVERGNGLPDLEPLGRVLDAYREAGFEIIRHKDLVTEADIPWYYPLTPRLTPSGLAHTRLGRWLSLKGIALAETLHIVPRGTYGALEMLQNGANALIASGKLGTFTPMHFVLVRKPLQEDGRQK